MVILQMLLQGLWEEEKTLYPQMTLNLVHVCLYNATQVICRFSTMDSAFISNQHLTKGWALCFLYYEMATTEIKETAKKEKTNKILKKDQNGVMSECLNYPFLNLTLATSTCTQKIQS